MENLVIATISVRDTYLSESIWAGYPLKKPGVARPTLFFKEFEELARNYPSEISLSEGGLFPRLAILRSWWRGCHAKNHIQIIAHLHIVSFVNIFIDKWQLRLGLCR